MTVYIEYVLLDNIIIDYLILKATYAITGKTVSRGRLFICALLGAVIELLYPLLKVIPLILTAVKILSGLLLVLLSAKFSRAKEFYISAVFFFALTFLAGGAVTGIFSIFNISPSSELSVGLMFLPVYLILKAVIDIAKYIYRKKQIAPYIYTAELTLFDRTVSALSFMDTGNCLTDGLEPVIVISKSLFNKLVGDNVYKLKVKRIDINSINGNGKSLSFKIDKIKLYLAGKLNIHNNVTACVANGNIGDGYDVILHPALMEMEYGIDDCETVKKSS